MNTASAWTVLGMDWDLIIKKLSDLPDHKSRVYEIERLFVDAEKLAKKLMVLHHPDKNIGDSEAIKRFQRVKQALDVIEKSTESFKSSYKAIKEKSEQRAISNGLIVIK